MRTWMAVAALVLTSNVADAGKGAASLLAAQAKAIGHDDYATLAATFTDDAILVLPGERSVQSGAAVAKWVREGGIIDGANVRKATAKHVKVGAIGTDAAWLTADLTVSFQTELHATTQTMRVSELAVATADGWKAAAADFSFPVTDADATATASDAESGADLDPIPGAQSSPDEEKRLASPGDLASALADDPATAVIGSASEKAIGKKKAARLLGGWAELSFDVAGGVLRVEHAGAYAIDVANLTLHGKRDVPYRVLVLWRATDSGWEIVSVHYSAFGSGV